MLTILSALDDRVRPKGSRDPLGMEAVWSHMGRKLVGNLTTVTGNLDFFTVALLCCRYANDSGSRSLDDIQSRYMRAEQLAGYLKLAAMERDPGMNYGFFGISRARERFNNDRAGLGISEAESLLADQLSYGLWGLYSTALEGAGLTRGARRELSVSGHAIAEAIVSVLGQAEWALFRRMCDDYEKGPSLMAKLRKIASPFGHMLGDAGLRRQLIDALLQRQRDCALQGELYLLAQRYLEQWLNDVKQKGDNKSVDVRVFVDWILLNSTASEAIKQVLRQVCALEPLLVAAAKFMEHLQQADGKSLAAIEKELSPTLKDLASFDSDWELERKLPSHAFLAELRRALNAKDVAATVRAIAAQNKTAMVARGGAPWVEFDARSALQVRVRQDAPPPERVDEWRNSYFLRAFLSVTWQGMRP